MQLAHDDDNGGQKRRGSDDEDEGNGHGRRGIINVTARASRCGLRFFVLA